MLNVNLKFLFSEYFVLLPFISFANQIPHLIWKSSYFGAIPNKKGISQHFCKNHEPGTFIGNVEDELARGAITNHHIKLDQFTFHVEQTQGIYLMHGTTLAHGVINHKKWQIPIQYYVYKLTPAGKTFGVWSSQECKGFYEGTIFKNKS